MCIIIFKNSRFVVIKTLNFLKEITVTQEAHINNCIVFMLKL